MSTIIHKKSKVVDNGMAKLPSAEQLVHGELAINYATGVETLSLKNDGNEIVTFRTDEHYKSVINEIEQVTAAAFNTIDGKIDNLEGKINNKLGATDIIGSGATTVSTNANGTITISSTDTKYTHPTTSGNKHIPAGGSNGQFLGYSADGTAAWVDNPASDKSDSTHNHGTLKLTGGVTGSATISSGTTEMTLTTTVTDDSHYHTLETISGGTVTITGAVTGFTTLSGDGTVILDTEVNHNHTFDSLTSKPTTLSGYCITDAATKDEINEVGERIDNLVTEIENNELIISSSLNVLDNKITNNEQVTAQSLTYLGEQVEDILSEMDTIQGTVKSVTVQGTNGLTGSGTITSDGTITISHATASTTTTSSESTLTHGGSFKIPVVSKDNYGHITGVTETTYTLQTAPDHTKTSTTAGTAGTTDNTSGATISIPYVTVNENGHVTTYGTRNHTITGSDLGLGQALKYCGKTTTILTDGSTATTIIINGVNHTAEAGCVVFYEDKEFVYNGSSWELLGAEVTYKVIQSAVNTPSTSGEATAFIDTISQDANGVITVTKKNVSFPMLTGENNITITTPTDGTMVISGPSTATTSTFGVTKLTTGDVDTMAFEDGIAAGIGHTHSVYSNAIDGVGERIDEILVEMEDNELVIAQALNYLDEKIDELSDELEHTTEVALSLSTNVDRNDAQIKLVIGDVGEIRDKLTELSANVSDVYNDINDNEYVTAKAITDLENRVSICEDMSEVLQDNTKTDVTTCIATHPDSSDFYYPVQMDSKGYLGVYPTHIGKVSATAYTTSAGGIFPLLAHESTGTTIDGAYKSADVYISGSTMLCATNGFQQASDERKKNFLNDITVDFEKLRSIPKSYFTWKNSDDKALHIGTSAQAVQEIYPELVGVNSETGELSLNYALLSVIALKAVDVLYEENKEMKERLDKIEKALGL